MKKYGETFLTRARVCTYDLAWVKRSRMQFRPHEQVQDCYELSLLGVINGCPLLSRYWRLAVTTKDGGDELFGLALIRASRCR